MSCATVMSPVVQPLGQEEPCRLLQLPDEVKLEIVKHVHRNRDLYNFSLACRSLEDMTLSKLYKSIDLDIPDSETPSWSQEGLPAFRPYVLQNMRELAIRNGISDERNPIYHKRRRSDANTMEEYVGEIFRGIPQDRLKAFSFRHQTPMGQQMVDGITKQHGRGLRHLQCCELELLNKPDISLPSKLRSLECRSVLSGEAITKLIANNKSTLRSLSLGQDKYLLQQYRERRIGFLSNVPQPLSPFYSTLDLSTLPNLKTLSLSGLDLAPLTLQTLESALCLTQLESLTLESCPNTDLFLNVLTETFKQHKQVALKKFSIRHEFFTTPLRDALTSFLTSFTGLTSLTILAENTTSTAQPSTFLTPHGPTLEVLVLESRVQPREHLQIDTSRPQGSTGTQSQRWLSTLKDITTLCPHLSELGIAFPWDDAAVHTSQITSSLGTQLKNLRTLHIRNFPSSTTCTSPEKFTETRLRSHAAKLLAWLAVPASSDLDTLAIGPTVYSSRWRLSVPTPTTPTVRPVHVSQLLGSTDVSADEDATQQQVVKKAKKHHVNSPPEHLCTHYFAVGAGAVVEGVDERFVEEGRGKDWRGGLGGVFDGVWLR